MNEEVKEKPLNNGKITGKDSGTGKFLEGNKFGKGRPKGSLSLLSILKELLVEMIKEKTTGEMKEKARAMMEIYLKKAILDEDKDVIKDIINRIDGMPKQTLGFDPEDLITSLKVEIVRPKPNGEKNSGNNSVGKEQGGIREQKA